MSARWWYRSQETNPKSPIARPSPRSVTAQWIALRAEYSRRSSSIRAAASVSSRIGSELYFWTSGSLRQTNRFGASWGSRSRSTRRWVVSVGKVEKSKMSVTPRGLPL